jgi:uncharacterized Rmd1/YagE family protein
MGWGDAYAGLSQQAFGFAIDTLRGRQQQKYQTERDEIASKAQAQQEEARRNWEQKMLKMRADVDKSARKDEQMFRSTEAEKARKYDANDPFKLAAEDRAERMTKVQEQYASRSAGGGSSSGGGTGLAQPRVPDSVFSQANKDFTAEVEALVAAGRTPEQAQGEAFAKLQSIYDRDILARIRPGLSNMQGQVSRTVGAMGRKAGDVMQYFNP